MAIVIAEIGENHCGNMEWAKEMIRVSAAAGCDYAKFQLYDASRTSHDDDEREWFFKVMLNQTKVEELMAECDKVGMKFLCTPWDSEQVKVLLDAGNKEFKIASFLITDDEMLKLLNSEADTVFISSGMADLKEVDHALSLLKDVDVYLMHCVSEYPLRADHVNLKIMDTLRERYPNVKVGYSDHTIGVLAPVLAVARGAEVVEKHITLDNAMDGTDHILSADPLDLKIMVAQIRLAEKMLGDGEKIVTPLEQENQEFLRKRFSN